MRLFIRLFEDYKRKYLAQNVNLLMSLYVVYLSYNNGWFPFAWLFRFIVASIRQPLYFPRFGGTCNKGTSYAPTGVLALILFLLKLRPPNLLCFFFLSFSPFVPFYCHEGLEQSPKCPAENSLRRSFRLYIWANCTMCLHLWQLCLCHIQQSGMSVER